MFFTLHPFLLCFLTWGSGLCTELMIHKTLRKCMGCYFGRQYDVIVISRSSVGLKFGIILFLSYKAEILCVCVRGRGVSNFYSKE